jgi:putative nucleotidyltransferase with HDIG domain
VRVGYRLRQLQRALRPHIGADEAQLVTQLLSTGEQQLFAAMSRFDQRHALDVAQLLRAQGHDQPTLLRAALLHDCGKIDDAGRPIPLVYYGVFVVLEALAPALYRSAARYGRGPLRPFRVHAEHAQRGARLARAAGSSSEVVELIENYHYAASGTAGALLRWADESC